MQAGRTLGLTGCVWVCPSVEVADVALPQEMVCEGELVAASKTRTQGGQRDGQAQPWLCWFGAHSCWEEQSSARSRGICS